MEAGITFEQIFIITISLIFDPSYESAVAPPLCLQTIDFRIRIE